MGQWIIGFIIKIRMQPSSPISAYKEAEENESPPVPSVLRSRHKHHLDSDPLRRVRQLVTQPAEIVVNAHRYNQQHGVGITRREEGIRGEIDACLTAVEKVYEQQARRKGSRSILTELSAGEPVIGSSSIHRVDAGLILKYIGTIRQDYNLPQRFGEARRTTILDPRSPSQQQIARNPEETFTSTEKRGRSRRSFINMTLSTNRDKRPDSIAKPSNASANRGKSPSTVHESRHIKPQQERESPHKTHILPRIERIPEDYKFCIACEQSVLASNIAYHEQRECPEIQQLYRLSFNQLRQYIAEKINKFRHTLHDNLQQMHGRREKGDVCGEVVDSIQKYLEELQGDDQTRELSFLQVRENYLRFQQTLKGEFFDSLALTHKLDYFIRVYVQLTRTRTLNQRTFVTPPSGGRGEEEVMTAPVSHFRPEQ